MYLATAVDQTCQEQRAQENQLPREGKGGSAVVKALAPRAYCGTKGNVLLRRARSLALTIVSVRNFKGYAQRDLALTMSTLTRPFQCDQCFCTCECCSSG